MTVVFNTATTLDGYIADETDSLEWLFSVPGAEEAESNFSGFLAGVGALIMGSTTYEWMYRHELRDSPEKWTETYADRPSFVFSSRALPTVPDLDSIRFVTGDVRAVWPEIEDAARGRDIWIVGGGDLAGQVADAGLLDEIRVSIAPATLGTGRPLFPRRLESDRLHLHDVRQSGQFAELTYRLQGSP